MCIGGSHVINHQKIKNKSMKVGNTLTGALSYSLSDNVMPQFIVIQNVSGDFPTRVQVRIAGKGVIKDVSLAQMIRESESFDMLQSIVVAPIKCLRIALADGYLANQRLEVTITCSDTSDSNAIYFSSFNKAEVLLVSEQTKCFSGQAARFTKFANLVLEGAGASDRFTINFNNGVSHNFDYIELVVYLCEKNPSSAPTTDLEIDNLDQEISLVEWTPSADRNAYVSRWEFI